MVSMVEGLPGSGKSLMLTEKALNYIKLRRPVYTNLPLKFRVMRSWLYRRGGPAFANLIQPLTRAHFLAFCERQDLYAKFKAECRLSGIHQHREHVRLFKLKHGPNILHGPGANWIPPYAVLIIDECHHWFSAKDQMVRGDGRGESPYLLAYLTMHRHHGHDLWFATQDKMQVSVTVRRLSAEFWLVRDIAKVPVWQGLHFGMLGMKMLEYKRFNAFDYDKDTLDKCTPIQSFWVWPGLPSRKWIFRLYESFTHAGSLRELRAQLEMARDDAGVSQLEWKEPIPLDRDGMKSLAIAAVCLLVGAWFGYLFAKPPKLLNDYGAAAAQATPGAPGSATPPVPAGPAPGPAWIVSGTTKGAAFVGRSRVQRGDVHDGYLLDAVGADGSTLWLRLSDGVRFIASRGAAPVIDPRAVRPGVG